MMSTPTLAHWRAEGSLVPLTVGARTVTVFRRSGGPSTGEVWTLLHGWPASSWDWALVAPAIERTHRTVLLDWPGVGASAKGAGVEYTIDALAETVVALWRHDGITATRIVAHDIGTIVTQQLLARELEGRLDVDLLSVTYLNAALYPDLYRPAKGHDALADPVRGPSIAAAMDAELYASGLAATYDPAHQPTPEALADFWLAFGGSASAAEMPRFMRAIAERRDRADRLIGAIESTPVAQRFIWGDRDPIAGSAQVDRIQQRFGPSVDLVAFEDCAHYPHVERPDDVVQEMLRPW